MRLNFARVLVWAFLVTMPTMTLPLLSQALEVPPLNRQVIDLANVLSPDERQQIEGSLLLFQKEYGPQIQVLTLPSLEGEPIESYSIKVVDAWKLGDKKRDDGVLLLVVSKDHEVRIEVGQGLEGQLPDVLAGRIIRDVMIPYFKEDRYDSGIFAGLSAIAGRLGGTLKNVPAFAQNTQSGNSSLSTLLFLFILFFIILPRMFGGGGGRRRGRQSESKDFLTGMAIGGLFGSGKGRDGDGFGGGGFGGGGGFSGGGASGKW